MESRWCLCSRRLLKTFWQKVKLLIMSNFSFCHNIFTVFKQLLFSLIEIFCLLLQNCLCGKGYIFYRLQTTFERSVIKGKSSHHVWVLLLLKCCHFDLLIILSFLDCFHGFTPTFQIPPMQICYMLENVKSNIAPKGTLMFLGK